MEGEVDDEAVAVLSSSLVAWRENNEMLASDDDRIDDKGVRADFRVRTTRP